MNLKEEATRLASCYKSIVTIEKARGEAIPTIEYSNTANGLRYCMNRELHPTQEERAAMERLIVGYTETIVAEQATMPLIDFISAMGEANGRVVADPCDLDQIKSKSMAGRLERAIKAHEEIPSKAIRQLSPLAIEGLSAAKKYVRQYEDIAQAVLALHNEGIYFISGVHDTSDRVYQRRPGNREKEQVRYDPITGNTLITLLFTESSQQLKEATAAFMRKLFDEQGVPYGGRNNALYFPQRFPPGTSIPAAEITAEEQQVIRILKPLGWVRKGEYTTSGNWPVHCVNADVGSDTRSGAYGESRLDTSATMRRIFMLIGGTGPAQASR